MRWSRLFIPTLREDPAGIESPARRLAVRAGYQRQLESGAFGNLLLAMRSTGRIRDIILEEFRALGAAEVRFPGPEPAWPMADVARGELRSARQMPQLWHQIASRAQGLALDCCSFDGEPGGQAASFRNLEAALRRILDRCGLPAVEARGAFFMPCAAGPDHLVRCAACGYAAGLDRASGSAAPLSIPDPEGGRSPEAFHTPGRKTIAEVADFTGMPAASQMKSLVLVADGRPVLVMVRGDDQMSGAKLLAALGAREYRPATASEIGEWFGAEPGSLGPVGVKLRTLADLALRGRRNMISGANRTDYHLRNVTPGRDFQPEFLDLRRVAGGDACTHCGGPLAVEPAIELGHVRKLEGESMPFICTGHANLDRIFLALAGHCRDENGLCLPQAVAPFPVVITPLQLKDELVRSMAEQLAGDCESLGIEALYDDRDERPGVKFKDADLIGVPWRLTVGAKKAAQGLVEVHNRATGANLEMSPADALAAVSGTRSSA